MRRVCLSTVSCVFKLYLLCSTIFALPVGNCSDPLFYDRGVCDRPGRRVHGRCSYYGDFVFNRHMEEMADGDPGADIHCVSIMTNGGMVTLDFCDYLDLFFTVGATQIAYASQNSLGSYGYCAFSTSTSWSLGGVLDLWHCGNFGMGIEGQYFQTKPLLTSYVDLQNGQKIAFNRFNRMKWWEWQGGLTATYAFIDQLDFLFAPYFGIKAATAKLGQHGFRFFDDGLPIELNLLESAKLWGFAFGLTVVARGAIGVNVEGRWADEKALSLMGEVAF